MHRLDRAVAAASAALLAVAPVHADYVPNLRSPAMDAPPVNDVILNGLGPNTIKRALSGVLADFPIYAQWYGAKCDGSSDDRAAYQKAFDVAKISGRPVHIGGKDLCVIGGSLKVSGRQTMQGDGQSKSILVGAFNGPIFIWDTNGPGGVADQAEVGNSLITGFTLRGQFAPSADYSASRGFVFGGGNKNFFQYNHFSGLTFESLYAAFDIQKDTRQTEFGAESNAAWLTFNDITIRSGSRDAIYGWLWNFGSGTGTTYSNIKTAFTTPDAAVFYYKAGVVGDIVINGGHFGGNGSRLIKVDAVTSYRNNILVSGSQLDAGMNVPFDFAPNAPAFARISFTGNNIGGGVEMKYPPVSSSLIDDQLADQRRAGKVLVPGQIAATGQQTKSLFTVTLDGLNPYTGTSCTVVVSGLVAGLAGGVTETTFLIGRNGGGAPNAVVVGSPASTVALPQFFSITATPIAGTGDVTISTNFVPSAAGSQLDAQIRCMGGTYSVTRL